MLLLFVIQQHNNALCGASAAELTDELIQIGREINLNTILCNCLRQIKLFATSFADPALQKNLFIFINMIGLVTPVVRFILRKYMRRQV